ncbi:Gfo/Idh/MocA family protein [Gemmata sp.]|uniref:Gfo/Idh/MocA family protein n=1 Tax=Gemmata sp. TaxID=1914242 RepID=UPI003F71FA99
MSLFNRREFLERTAILSAAAASLGSGAALAETKPVAARAQTDKLRVAVVGVRGRGMAHVGGFLGKNNCEITTVCDCDEAVIGSAMKAIEGKQGKAPTYVKDIRKVVEDKDIDVVSIATPNHWHALMAVWAMENGKDVYCEKPATHNVHEGAIMVAAARKYKRICQVGTQSRSNPGMQQAIEYVRGGKIGKADLAISLCFKPRGSIGKVEKPTAPPASMDYDLWSGPAPLAAVNRSKIHYDWHWIWAYGNGDLGNQGVHEMDKARWGLGKNTMPNTVFSVGGRFGYVDDGETANTQLSVFDYGAEKMVSEVRGLTTDAYKSVKVGNIWVGPEGYVACPNYAGGVAYDKDGKEVAKFSGGGDQHHFDNFVKAVRSRKVEDLNCDVAEGHLSAALCHLANISYRLGTEQPVGKVAAVSDHKAVNEFAARMLDHLKANKIDTEKTVGKFGPLLTMDPKTEQFVGTDKPLLDRANAMLFREYRKGFELKEIA